MHASLIAVRLVHFTAAMAVFGGAAFRVYGLAGGVGPAHREALAAFDGWLRRLVAAAAAGALAPGLLMVPCVTAVMANSASAAADPAMLGAVLFGTAFGHAWCGHLLLVFLLSLAAVATKRTGPVLGLALLALASLAAVGHTADAAGWAGIGRQANQAVHLLAAGLWLGGLVPLGWLLRCAASDRGEGFAAVAREAVPAFSQMGYAAVALIAITGAINSLIMVGSAPALFSTDYGRLLSLKILLYLAMVALALVNRFRLAPLLARRQDATTAPRALYRSVLLEQALGLAILAAVAFLGTLPPPVNGR